MKITRLLKTIFMLDFITGLLIAIREIFKSKKTINYPATGNIPKKNRKLAVKTTQSNDKGRKNFQPNLIN